MEAARCETPDSFLVPTIVNDSVWQHARTVARARSWLQRPTSWTIARTLLGCRHPGPLQELAYATVARSRSGLKQSTPCSWLQQSTTLGLLQKLAIDCNSPALGLLHEVALGCNGQYKSPLWVATVQPLDRCKSSLWAATVQPLNCHKSLLLSATVNPLVCCKSSLWSACKHSLLAATEGQSLDCCRISLLAATLKYSPPRGLQLALGCHSPFSGLLQELTLICWTHSWLQLRSSPWMVSRARSGLLARAHSWLQQKSSPWTVARARCWLQRSLQSTRQTTARARSELQRCIPWTVARARFG